MTDLPHLRLENTKESAPYTSAGIGRGGVFRLPPRDRAPHAARLRQELVDADSAARATREAQGLDPDGAGEIISVRSEPGHDLNLDSLELRRSGIELLSVAMEDDVVVANVYVPRGKHVLLLRKIDAYGSEDVPRTGQPKNRKLIESISSIRLAAIRDLWADEPQLFPENGTPVWWEAWLRAGGGSPSDVHRHFADLASRAGLRTSEEFVAFPERVVTLAYGTREQMSASIDLMSSLAEVRRAKELSGDYLELSAGDQRDVANELLGRLVPPGGQAPAVCILDTGVNRDHPLLGPALAAADTQSVRPAQWGAADDSRQHGTGMAGIALYGCLTEALAGTDPIVLTHRLESVKILPPPPGQNEPRDYGPFTIQAVARAEIQAPQRNRAICLAVTADHRDLGLPSLWSASVDQLCSGAPDDASRLLFISAGNLRDEFHDPAYRYPQSNFEERAGIEDPGQSWNAVTVGAYTEKVFIQDPRFNGWQPIAGSRDLCPTSRTSLGWPDDHQRGWPFKPDIVLEGGNYAANGTQRSNCPDLSLLTTTLPPHSGKLFEITTDTSPATAAAARMAARLWGRYPRLWPETVRGLIVHSASWTDAMIRRFPGPARSEVQKRLRCYGYGVPDLRRAMWSAENAATMIYEGEIQPYVRVDGEVRSNEMHLHHLPWPVQVLEDLGEAQVRMRVTLSYFIEPSPGRVGWTRKHRYQSHGLRFDVIRPTENDTQFRRRISREAWEDPESRPDNVAETRNWEIGEHGRTRGSLHSDWWSGTASELASCRHVAVFPVTGWWRERPHLERHGRSARYSLIVTIESPDQEIDLYTPITAEVAVATELETE